LVLDHHLAPLARQGKVWAAERDGAQNDGVIFNSLLELRRVACRIDAPRLL
jgi:hypothetical protein